MSKLYTIALILLSMSKAMASDTHLLSGLKKKMPKNFNISLAASYSSNFYETDNPDFYNNLNSRVNFSYKLPKGIKSSLSMVVNKDLQGERETKLYDGSVRFSKGNLLSFGPNDFAELSSSLSFLIPLSENSRKNSKLLTRVSVAPSIGMNLSKIGAKNFYAQYGLNVSKAFNEYETALSGASNKEWNFSNSLYLAYSLPYDLSISLTGVYGRSLTYQGNSSDFYSFSQSLGWSFNGMNLEIGHTNGGNPLRPNGFEYELNLFDSKSSTFYLQVSTSI